MATASDNFDRANETPLAGNWTCFGGGGTPGRFNLSGNIAVASAPGTDDANAYWNANSFGADQFSEAKLTVSGTLGGGRGIGLLLRTDHAATVGGVDQHTQYRLVVDHATSNNVDLGRITGGVYTNLANWTVNPWSDGDTWRVEISGYVITVYRNGTSIGAPSSGSNDDSASPSKIASGQLGIAFSSNETSASVNDWSGGDLSTGTLQTVSAVGGIAKPTILVPIAG